MITMRRGQICIRRGVEVRVTMLGAHAGSTPSLRPSLAFPILVQRPRKQSLNHSLPAYVEFRRPLIEIPQHALSEIDIHAAHRSDHGELVRKVRGNVFAA